MNTESVEYKRVREQVACLLNLTSCHANCKPEYKDCVECPEWERCLKRADQILHIQKPDGTEALGVISDEQDLPKTPGTKDDHNVLHKWFIAGMLYMKRDAGWVKVIGELK